MNAPLNNDDFEFRDEWAQEIERRSKEIDEGKAKLISLAEMKRFFEKLKRVALAKRAPRKEM